MATDGTNVGIGTASPGAKLDVYSETAIRSTRTSDITKYTEMYFGGIRNSATNSLYIIPGVGYGVDIGSNGTTGALVTDSSGNVGIGTASPVDKFEVNGAITSTSAMIAAKASSVSLSYESTPIARLIAFGANTSTNGALSVISSRSDGSNQLTWLHGDIAGNVGIGETDMSVSGANAKLAIDSGYLDFDSDYGIAWGGATGRPSVIGNKSTNTVTIQGNVSKPQNPAFLAYNSAVSDNVTGDVTGFTIDYAGEIFDQGADFNTSTYTFTAPVAGRYFLSAFALIGDIHTDTFEKVEFRIVTSNRNVYGTRGSGLYYDSSNYLRVQASGLVDMDAADTAHVLITISGGTKTADIHGSADGHTSFSGWLAN
jgi:hypothetical protein